MASLADNVARVIKVFDTLKAKVTNYVGIGSGNVSIPGSNIDTNHNISIETYVNAIDEVHAYGVEKGKQAQYDEFWDSLQEYGKRTNWSYVFSGYGWNDKTFKPKYDITFEQGTDIFRSCQVTNLKKILNDCNVRLDFENCNPDCMYYFAINAKFTHVPEVGNTNLITAHHAFRDCKLLESVDNFIVGEKTDFSYCFLGTSALKEIRFSGIIAKNVDFKDCPLSKESTLSIFSALSPTAEGVTVTFNKKAANNAFGINVDDETTYTDEWKELMASKPNWNIAFANA